MTRRTFTNYYHIGPYRSSRLMFHLHYRRLISRPRQILITSTQNPIEISVVICLCAVWTPPHNPVQPISICLGVRQCKDTITCWTHLSERQPGVWWPRESEPEPSVRWAAATTPASRALLPTQRPTSIWRWKQPAVAVSQRTLQLQGSLQRWFVVSVGCCDNAQERKISLVK